MFVLPDGSRTMLTLRYGPGGVEQHVGRFADEKRHRHRVRLTSDAGFTFGPDGRMWNAQHEVAANHVVPSVSDDLGLAWRRSIVARNLPLGVHPQGAFISTGRPFVISRDEIDLKRMNLLHSDEPVG